MDKDTHFVIGDVHGNVHLIERLLEKAGVDDAIHVVQVGDLIQSDRDSQDRDLNTVARAEVDSVLWGDHDRAMFDRNVSFGGYWPPLEETKQCIETTPGKYHWAMAVGDFLITHAGLSVQAAKELCVTYEDPPDLVVEDLAVSDEIVDRVRNNIGPLRGGFAPWGGIMWRDELELLWRGFKQIHGHSITNSRHVEKSDTGEQHYSYNIDVGGKGGRHLAGIFLPSERIVEL